MTQASTGTKRIMRNIAFADKFHKRGQMNKFLERCEELTEGKK